MKTPEKVNLGGLWLMNPHAPRCHPSTNLEGAGQAPHHQPQYGTTLHDHFKPGGSSYAGSANALPPAWRLDVPSGILIQTASTIPEDGPFWEPFRGTHILRTQRFREEVTGDGKCHPRYFDPILGHMPPVNHAAWYDSLLRREIDPFAPGGTYRGFFWSLYWGNFCQGFPSAGPTVFGSPSWWIVAGLEPVDTRSTDTTDPPFRFFSMWRHHRPLADETPNHPTREMTARFNPLGKNVFVRTDEDGTPQPAADQLTIEPFYG